ncbi:MAG: hypothetical protein NWE94_03380 [Candidatus Bathyarchaeota archaeon]|nr:hypothetical protein [Candidatus Bathyarchaeota archaeon]
MEFNGNGDAIYAVAIFLHMVGYSVWARHFPILLIVHIDGESYFLALQIDELVRYDFDFYWSRAIIVLI